MHSRVVIPYQQIVTNRLSQKVSKISPLYIAY